MPKKIDSKAKTTPKKVTVKAAKKAAPKAPVKKVAAKSAPKKAVTKKAIAKKVVAKKAAPKKTVPKAVPKAAPKKAAPKPVLKKPVAKKASNSKLKAAPPVELKTKKTVPESKNPTKDRLRKLLLAKREEIVRESKAEIKKYISGENRQLVETVMDEGDLSVVDLSEDISLKQLSTHREVLMKIDTALRKLEEDTYGMCEECGDEISEQRLKILPFAIYCRDCQESKEVFEKLAKEER